MVVGSSSPSSSLSSVSSLSSFGSSSAEEVTATIKASGCNTVKFLCSYGGKILPRYPDGKLRYVGGDTRVLAVDRSVTFTELAAKLGELCGWGVAVSLRCQLPTEDLDALVSVTSDEDLANLFEEYDLASRDRASPLKIRAFLFPLSSSRQQQSKAATTPPPSSSSAKGKIPFSPAAAAASGDRCLQHHQISSSASSGLPGRLATDMRYHHHNYQHQHQHHHRLVRGSGGNPAYSYRHHPPQHVHLVHHGNHWQ